LLLALEFFFVFPVVVYSSVIVVMALACLNLKGRIPMGIFQLLFLGVVFFVISDTLIGINKFKTPILYGQSWIMLLYLTGQWLIMEGTIKMHKLMNEKPNC
ncbi:MAG: lysoplasmalogenase family protein, partial [Saprospiraceae bacterium]